MSKIIENFQISHKFYTLKIFNYVILCTNLHFFEVIQQCKYNHNNFTFFLPVLLNNAVISDHNELDVNIYYTVPRFSLKGEYIIILEETHEKKLFADAVAAKLIVCSIER